MASRKNKMVALALYLLNIFQMVYSHEELVNSLTDSSDDMEVEPVRKRVFEKPDAYNGMAIDISPSLSSTHTREFRTHASKLTKQSTRTSSTVDLRRYRRIYNPDESASVQDYPFMAALLMNGHLWCGGAIVSHDKVLTAAHCMQLQYNNRFFREYVKMLTVRVGSNNASAGGDVYRVTEIFFHPNYKPNTLDFNVAVVKLQSNITTGAEDNVDLIKYSRDRIVPTDTRITFLGWGSVWGYGGINEQVLLQKVNLPVYDISDCQDIYGKDLVTRMNFCAGYITVRKNVCNHDAGGPAVMDGVLIGILSFSSKRCDLPDQPAVFTGVGAIADWLDKVNEETNN